MTPRIKHTRPGLVSMVNCGTVGEELEDYHLLIKMIEMLYLSHRLSSPHKDDRDVILLPGEEGSSMLGSQFFITTAETPWLNMRHTIFGEVVEGYDVIEKLENVEVDPRDKPRKAVKIEEATLL